MEEIYQILPEGIFNDFNGFSEYVNQNGIQSVYEMLPEGIFNDEKGFMDYASKLKLSEKKNQVDTPSDGEEEVTEYTTETEITPGSLDSSDQTPIEIPIVEEEEEIVFDETTPENQEFLVKNQSNIDLLNSVGYIEANEGVKSMISTEGLTDFDKERLESREKTYRLKNNETGEFEYKKESEIKPEILETISIYETSKDNSYTPNYLDVQVDIKDFQRDDVPDANKLDSLGINQEDYLKWDKVNTRQEGSVFKFMKNILLDDEYSDFEKEQRQYEKLQSYQATQLNGITNDLDKNQALQKLTSDPENIKVLKKEEKELQKKFYDKVGVMSKSIDLFPKFKDATVDTELEKRKRLYYAVKEGGLSEASQGTIELLKTGGTAIIDFTTNVIGGVPGFLDQRLTTLGYDKKGFLSGLSDMFTDSAEHVDLAYGGVKRSGFMSGKPVTYRGQQYFVDKNGKVYDEETNILMDGILPLSDVKEIQKRSKNVPEEETMWTGGSVVTGLTSTLVNLFGLIRTGGKVNNALGLKKYMKTGTAGKVAMGLTSFTSGVVDNVDDIRSQLIATGMSEKEAMNIAVNAGQAISTLDGVFSGLAGSNEKLLTGLTGIKNQIKNLAITKGKDFTAKELKSKSYELIKENAKELFIEELPVYFSEKGINYLVNRSIGQNVLDSKVTKEGVIETAVMTIGATSGLGGRKLLSGNRRSDLVRTIAADIGDLQGTLDILVKEGSLTKQESSNAYTEIYSMKTAENLTKGTVLVSENMETASDLLIQRKNLINKKEGLEGPGKQNIDNKIADVDAQLDALYARDKEDAKAILDREKDGEVKVEVTKEEALESLKSENEVRKKTGLPVVLESDENILKQQKQLLKEKQDAIQKPSTEEQVLPDASTSKEEGGDSEVGLQQVREGDTQQVTTETKVEEGETQTDTTSDTTAQTDAEQLTEPSAVEQDMSVNNELDNKIESFSNRIAESDSSTELSEEAQQFYSENQEAIDNRVSEIRKQLPKDKSKTRRLATKIANGDTNYSNEQIDLYAANEAEVKAEVEAIAKTNSQTVTADTYKGILQSIKSTTRTDKAKQEGENAQRKRFWKSWNKSNREGKQDLKTKRKNLNKQIKTYAKGKKGNITAAQTKAVINKVNSVNLDNQVAVQELIEYSEKVFNDADYAAKILKAEKLNNRVTTRLNKGNYGLNPDLISRLGTILNTPTKNLTSENIDGYNDFLSNLLKQKQNVKLDDQLVIDSQNMADSLYNENIQDTDEETETKETKSLKTIVDKIINEDVDGETLILEDSKFIENDLDKLDSFTLQTLIDKINSAETDENQELVESANKFAENRQAVITKIKSRSKGISLKSLDNTTKEAGGVQVFQNIKDSDLIGLTGKQLDLLEVSLENINDGHYTHAANKLGQSINSRAYDMRPLVDKYGTTKNKIAMVKSRAEAALKAGLKNAVSRGANSTTSLEMLRTNPLSAVDNAFGNYKNNTIRNNSFEPIATKYSQFKSWSGRLTDKLDAVEQIIAPTYKEGTNPAVRRRFEIQTYLLALESESNAGNKGVAQANEFIDKTIENFNDSKTASNYTQADIDILLDIKAKNSEGGVITTKKMKQNLSPQVMKAIGIMQEIYGALGDKQAYATTIVRGNKLDLLNNYVHHKVDATKDKLDKQLISQKEYVNAKTSTESKSSISRTPGAKAIDFDPVATALRSLRMTGMDYYLTNEIQTSRKALNQLTRLSEQENATKEVIEATVSLSRAYDESIENVLSSNFSTDVIGGKYFDIARKVGYYSTLASAPRAVAELGSNLTFGLMAAPKELALGLGKYSNLSLMQNGLSFAENVGSTTVTKNWGSEILGGSKSEQSGVVRNKKGSKRASGSNIKSSLKYAGRFGKKFADGSEFLADNLLSTPDKMVSRPLFFGTFARVFKQETGQDMDADKISKNDEAYMTKYADAIQAAKRAADAKVTQAATSNDPFSGVLKNQLSDEDGARVILYKSINSYMARFTINEFVTARQAVASMVGQGEMGAIKGGATLAGVMTRMSMYVVMYKALASMFNGVLGLDDEDDIDYEELGTRQLVGAGVSLITRGTSGNFPMIPINLGIEKLNEEYGESLGLWSDKDGKGYNPYEHSLIFSVINQQKLEKEGVAESAIRIGAGPLAPQASSLLRMGDLLAKMGSKDKKVADRAAAQFLTLRTALEASQFTGVPLPLYKDIRRYLMADNWSDIKASKQQDLKLSDEDFKIIYGEKELKKRKAEKSRARKKSKNSTSGRKLKKLEDELKNLEF